MLDTIEATHEMHTALDHIKTTEAAKAVFIASESAKMRKTRAKKADETKRVKSVKSAKDEEGKRRIAVTVMEEGGKKRTVKRLMTTADKMMQNKLLPKVLKSAIDGFALLVADGYGVATTDGQDSTSRLTCSYEPMSGSGYGSKTLSDTMLNGLSAYKSMRSRVPAGMLQTFDQIVGEETGNLKTPRRTLAQIGEDAGYTHKQASSAGGMQVICVAELIAHYMKERAQMAT